jgi:SAM-dependent methyltransferase
MDRSFSLFQGHLDFAHLLWHHLLCPSDWAIDATCGNGRDTLKLAALVGETGGVISIDIQEVAIHKTKELLQEKSPHKPPQIHFFCQSHASFPPLCYEKKIRLIVYNLGYLPGGDKSLTTMRTTTLASLEAAMALVAPGGVISVMCYPGHLEGAQEEKALLQWSGSLPREHWSCSFHSWRNRESSPSLLLFQKTII